MLIKPMESQVRWAELWGEKKRMLNFSAAGTGKTIACLLAIQKNWPEARVLVIGTLSTLKRAWADDIKKACPDMTHDIAYARNRKKAFTNPDKPQVIITNHDAIKDIVKNHWYTDFDVLIVDEADKFRNAMSQRSKALTIACNNIDNVTLMTATPAPKSILDMWNLVRCIDFGQRLGKTFIGFREQVCTPVAVTSTIFNWVDKPNARELVTSMIEDITYRVTLDEVAEMPELIQRIVTLKMPSRVRTQYRMMMRESAAVMNDVVINATHAGIRFNKMLQMCSGAVYESSGKAIVVDESRYELINDLVEESGNPVLVGFNWKHQKDGLTRDAEKRKLEYGVIDGSTPVKERERLINRFQARKLDVLYCHPKSAAHGITLTEANRCILASPISEADIYEQFIHRIYRNGQTKKCEIIHVGYENSYEEEVYKRMIARHFDMQELLRLVVELSKAA